MSLDAPTRDSARDDALQHDLPPPVPAQYRNRADTFVRSEAPPKQRARVAFRRVVSFAVRTSEESADASGLQRSTSWLTSVTLHLGLLLLIAMLMAPADFGQHGARAITLRLAEEQSDEQMPSIPIAVSLPEPEPTSHDDEAAAPEDAVAEPTPKVPETKAAATPIETASVEIPKPTATGIAIASTTVSAKTKTQSGGANANADRVSGSFFGINAEGHEFVYVLDRSTSMEGMRYRRAVAELIRSVNSLSEKQSFYVFLFGKTTVRMFNSKDDDQHCVAATASNKSRLENWLHETSPAGNTDPREALYLAYGMKPAAIFMLSDGEFTDKKHSVAKLPYRGSTFALVDRLTRYLGSASIPIHAIAYEDPKSRQNMQRLADMTGGTYRYVKHKEKTADQLLAEATDAIKLDEGVVKTSKLNELVLEFGKRRIPTRARDQFGTILYDDALKASKQSGDTASDVLAQRLIQLDRLHLRSGDNDTRVSDLLPQVVEYWSQIGTDKAIEKLSQLGNRLQSVPNRMLVRNTVAEKMFQQAETMRDDGDRFGSYAKYRYILQRHPNSEVAADCLERCQEVEQQIEDLAQRVADKGEIGKAIRFLRTGETNSKHRETASMWRRGLTDLVEATFAKIRDAEKARDGTEKRLLLEQLNEAFDDPGELGRYRRGFATKEAAATKQLNLAVKYGRRYPPAMSLQKFENIVKQFPHTVAAQSALRYLPREDEPDEMEMLIQ